MRTRLIASVAVGAALLLTTSGCALMSEQATTIQYAPSDGVNPPQSGPLEVRNALIVANDEGTEGNMIAAVVNDTDEAHTLSLGLGEGGEAGDAELRVPANSVISLGVDEEPLLIENLDTIPGALFPVYFQSGDAEGVLWEIPVLDGELDQYAEFVP